jgi:mRNA interferase MazF
VKRGDIWTVAGGPDYSGKDRPALGLQDDAFEATASITICPVTTHVVDAPLVRRLRLLNETACVLRVN